MTIHVLGFDADTNEREVLHIADTKDEARRWVAGYTRHDDGGWPFIYLIERYDDAPYADQSTLTVVYERDDA